MTATPDALAASADELIAEALAPADAPDPDRDDTAPWEITGHKTADWAVARIRAAHQRFHDETVHLRDAREALELRIAELDGHIAERAKRRDHTVGFFEAKLTDWLRRLRRDALAAGEDPAKAVKSVPLSGGVVKSRAARDRVEVVDVERVARWGATLVDADVVRWEPKVDRRAVARYIAETGEVPPGVEYIPATEDERAYSVDVS